MPRDATPFWTAGLFALLCLAWGSGWMALKIGVAALPPLLFASSRFLAAGAVLLGVLLALGRVRGLLAIPLRAVLPGAFLMIALNYGLMAWGVTRVASGLAAVVNLTTIPLAMAVCSGLYGITRFTRRTGAGLLLGSCGLAVLLVPPVVERASPSGSLAGGAAALGLVAIAAGAASYAWGSILTLRVPVLAPALEWSTLQALLGGAALLLASAAVEPWAGIGSAIAAPVRLGGWAFLVAVSVTSTPAYLALLARWEPTRVAAYAYVCPVIAVAEGSLFGGELLTVAQGAAAAVLGLSAYLVLRTSRTPPAPPEIPQPLPAPAPPGTIVVNRQFFQGPPGGPP